MPDMMGSTSVSEPLGTFFITIIYYNTDLSLTVISQHYLRLKVQIVEKNAFHENQEIDLA